MQGWYRIPWGADAVASLHCCVQAVDDEALGVLAGFSSLVSLGLPRCTGITDAGLAQLGGMPALAALDLRKCRHVTDASLLRLLGSLPALATLQAGGCFRLRDKPGLLEKAALRGVNLAL